MFQTHKISLSTIKALTELQFCALVALGQLQNLHFLNTNHMLGTLDFWVKGTGLPSVFLEANLYIVAWFECSYSKWILYNVRIVKTKTNSWLVVHTCIQGTSMDENTAGLEVVILKKKKIEHWWLNFQNWSPAGDLRFVRWLQKTTTELLFLNLYIRKSIGYGS